MSDFTILNYSTLEVIECNAGDTVHLNIPGIDPGPDAFSNAIGVEHTSAADKYSLWTWAGAEDVSLSPPAVGPYVSAVPPVIVFSPNNVRAPGVVTAFSLYNYLSGTDSSGTAGGVHFVLHYLADAGTMALPVSWMPPGPIDLQWDMFLGVVATNALAVLTTGLKQGSDVVFAVLPSQAGALIIADISALSLCIRPALDTQGYGPFILDTTSVDQVTVSGDEEYYRVNFNLASEALSAAFGDLNDALLQALAGTDATAILKAQAAAASIACVLELRATHTSGIYTSQTFPLNILQTLTP